MSREPSSVRPLALWLTASIAVVVLVVAGAQIASPPLEPGAWVDWIDRHGAPAGLMALVRFLALASAGYVAAVSLATAVVRRARWPSVGRIVDSLTTPALRRALHGAASLSLVLPMGSAGADTTPSERATIRFLEEVTTPPTTTAAPITSSTTPGTAREAPAPRSSEGTAAPIPSDGAVPLEDPPGGLPHTL